VDAMRADTGKRLKELRVDGGGSRSEPMMQFQADLLGVPVVRPVIIETTALGAAYLAGIGAGVLDEATIEKRWAVERRFDPTMEVSARDRLHADWKRAVERSLKWIEP
jgi:glycerol kinase